VGRGVSLDTDDAGSRCDGSRRGRRRPRNSAVQPEPTGKIVGWFVCFHAPATVAPSIGWRNLDALRSLATPRERGGPPAGAHGCGAAGWRWPSVPSRSPRSSCRRCAPPCAWLRAGTPSSS